MAGSFKITPGGTEESVARLEALGRLMDGAVCAAWHEHPPWP